MIGGSNIRCHFPEVWLKYILAFMLRKAEERRKTYSINTSLASSYSDQSKRWPQVLQKRWYSYSIVMPHLGQRGIDALR